ncbi:unnamed protein product [Ectocarpus fasciculatus]
MMRVYRNAQQQYSVVGCAYQATASSYLSAGRKEETAMVECWRSGGEAARFVVSHLAGACLCRSYLLLMMVPPPCYVCRTCCRFPHPAGTAGQIDIFCTARWKQWHELRCAAWKWFSGWAHCHGGEEYDECVDASGKRRLPQHKARLLHLLEGFENRSRLRMNHLHRS